MIKNCILVFMCSTCYWCLCIVPAIGVYVQYLLLVFMYSTCYSRQILIKLEFSQHIFEKCSNIKFHEHSFSESRVVTCGRRDMTNLIIDFLNFKN